MSHSGRRDQGHDVAADFHDIGKLLDWGALGLGRGHDFEMCRDARGGVNPCATPWPGIWQKDQEFRADRLKPWPDSLVWAWVILADQLAAGWGRGI